jgi:Tfp pilus assembly protein PilF
LRTNLLPLFAFVLVGCSGVEPDFLYTNAQATQVNNQIAELTSKPIQKYLAGVELSPADRASLEKALPLIDQIIEFDPITINSYSLKGKIHRALGQVNLAKEAFYDGIARSAPLNNPDDTLIRSDLYLELSQINYEEQNFSAAQIAIETSLKIDDESPAAHVLRARLYVRENKKQLANDHVLKALLLNAEYEPARVLFTELNVPRAASP